MRDWRDWVGWVVLSLSLSAAGLSLAYILTKTICFGLYGRHW